MAAFSKEIRKIPFRVYLRSVFLQSLCEGHKSEKTKTEKKYKRQLNNKTNEPITKFKSPLASPISCSPGFMNRPPWRARLIPIIALMLACFTLRREGEPFAQDACSTNYNTAKGTDALFSLTTGVENTAVGFHALYSITDTDHNTAVGFQALANSTQYDNTGVGYHALWQNTFGYGNTAFGVDSIALNSNGSFNTAAGFQALVNNDSDDNTAYGAQALFSNTTGSNNTANGVQALWNNTTGSENTATGVVALFSNTKGSDNTATGLNALYSNTTGEVNTATGAGALSRQHNGRRQHGYTVLMRSPATQPASRNTATGQAALRNNTTGTSNTATGSSALRVNTTGNDNTAIGHRALDNNPTGSSNIALGFFAGTNLTTGDNNIDIGNRGVAADESNTIRIGTQGTQTKTFIAGISGAVVMGPAVHVSSSGQLGAQASSRRFKDDIKPMDKASEAILALKPVSFRYKQEIDPDRTPQFGLVAEQVEKVDPALVARDGDGKPYTVRYEAVNAMLLNEFLKEHHQVQDLKAIVAQQQKEIEGLTAGLQKVSAQIEASKPAPQVVNNP